MITLYGSAADQTIARLIEVLQSGEFLCPNCGWPEGGSDHADVRAYGAATYQICLRPRLELG
jgi:hypothetical protein